MIKVSARTVSRDLAKYLDLANCGQEIVITKRGVPWARLMAPPLPPLKKPKKTKKLDWTKVFERTDAIFKGRKVEAVKAYLKMRDEARW